MPRSPSRSRVPRAAKSRFIHRSVSRAQGRRATIRGRRAPRAARRAPPQPSRVCASLVAAAGLPFLAARDAAEAGRRGQAQREGRAGDSRQTGDLDKPAPDAAEQGKEWLPHEQEVINWLYSNQPNIIPGMADKARNIINDRRAECARLRQQVAELQRKVSEARLP